MFRVIVNENSIVQLAIQIKNGIMINVNASVKSIVRAKEDYSSNPSTCFCENSKHLRHIVDDSLIACDEIYVMDVVSTNGSANVMSTVSTSFYKKVRYKMDCYSALNSISNHITIYNCY